MVTTFALRSDVTRGPRRLYVDLAGITHFLVTRKRGWRWPLGLRGAGLALPTAAVATLGIVMSNIPSPPPAPDVIKRNV